MKIPPADVAVINCMKNVSSMPSFVIESVMMNQEPSANSKRAIVFGVNTWRAKSFDFSFSLFCIRTIE